MFRTVALVTLLLTVYPANILAQSENVKDAIDVIVLFCVAGGEKFDIKGNAEVEGGLSIKKLGAKGVGNISISKTEAKGLVEGLSREMDKASADQASEARACMQPYIDKILSIILSETSPDSSISGGKVEQAAPREESFASVKIRMVSLRSDTGSLCIVDGGIYFNGQFVPLHRGVSATGLTRISSGSTKWVIEGEVLCQGTMICESKGEESSGSINLLPGRNYVLVGWNSRGRRCHFWLNEIDAEEYAHPSRY